MTINASTIDAVKIITQFRHNDLRGAFVKTFHQTTFAEAGIEFTLKESFFSISHRHVLRGMHFHHAPHDHAKIVFCTQGSILDVALDIRKNSDTFGQFVAAELSAENNKALYIPKGFAHGFLTLSESATTQYFVDGEYSPAHDDGILYNSFGMDWGVHDVTINERDKGFISLDNFKNKDA
jgi:dTDP-4-dehydrorhamnose 3,5-epimerase